MRYTAAAQALQKGLVEENHAILVYGPTKTGKTRLVATAAKCPEIKKINWVDLENGSSTILNMGLTEEELAKFIIFKIPDTKENPRGIETVLKMLSSKVAITVCDEHGKVNCNDCAKDAPREEFSYQACKHDELLVIDSGGQLGVSALNAATLGKGELYKPQLDDYGSVSKWLSDIFITIQQAKRTNIVVITHELLTDGEDGIERIYPLVGSKAFSSGVGKFFGTVVYTGVKLAKHVAGSSSTYKPNVITGSRLNIKMESKEPDMRTLLIEGGVLK